MEIHLDDSDSEDNSTEEIKPENDPSPSKNVISSSAIQRFQELKRRREELTAFSKWKLQKLENKKSVTSSQGKLKKSSSTTNNVNLATPENEWEDVKTKYIDINSHLAGPISHGEPNSGLEEDINKALSKGEIERAEELSDKLSKREFGVRLNDAFAAKRYAEELKVKRENQKKKKQKPRWGFETKKRWEMKGNM